MSELNLTHSNGNQVKLTTPDSLSANRTFKLPHIDGSANQFLKTDGSGALSFATASGTIKQVKYASTQANHTSTSSAYQNLSNLNVSITPTSSSNILIYQYALQFRVYENSNYDAFAYIGISDDAGSSYLAENYHRNRDYGGSGLLLDCGVSGIAVKTAGSTSARTYYLYTKLVYGDAYELNMASNQNTSAVTVMEVEP